MKSRRRIRHPKKDRFAGIGPLSHELGDALAVDTLRKTPEIHETDRGAVCRYDRKQPFEHETRQPDAGSGLYQETRRRTTTDVIHQGLDLFFPPANRTGPEQGRATAGSQSLRKIADQAESSNSSGNNWRRVTPREY